MSENLIQSNLPSSELAKAVEKILELKNLEEVPAGFEFELSLKSLNDMKVDFDEDENQIDVSFLGTTAHLKLNDPVLSEKLTIGQRLYELLEFLDLD